MELRLNDIIPIFWIDHCGEFAQSPSIMPIRTLLPLFIFAFISSCSLFHDVPLRAAYKSTTTARTYIDQSLDQEVVEVEYFDAEYNLIDLSPKSDTTFTRVSMTFAEDRGMERRMLAYIHNGDTVEQTDIYYDESGREQYRYVQEYGDTVLGERRTYDDHGRLRQVDEYDDGEFSVASILDYNHEGELIRESFYTSHEMLRYIKTYERDGAMLRTYWSTEEGERGSLHTTEEDKGMGLTETKYYYNGGAIWYHGISYSHQKGDFTLEKRDSRGELEWLRGYAQNGDMKYEVEVEWIALQE